MESPQNVSLTTVSDFQFNEGLMAQFDIFFNCYFLHILCLLGVLTNALNICVLWRHSFRETTTIWLWSMSFCDLITSLLQPLRRINCIVNQFDLVAGLTSRAVSVVYLVNAPDVFCAVSILHTTAIAVERLAAVWFPLHVARIFTPSRVRWMILVMYVYTTVMLCPTWFFLTFDLIFDSKLNVTRGAYFLSQFYASDYDGLNKYSSGSLTHLFTTSTFIVIVTCSVVLTFKLTIGRSKTLSKMSSRNVSSTRQVRDLKVVKMLLTVCMVNAIVSVPTVTIQLYLLYSNLSLLSAGKVHYLLRSVVSVLFQINADVNFIVYVTMSSKFARTLGSVLYCNIRYMTSLD